MLNATPQGDFCLLHYNLFCRRQAHQLKTIQNSKKIHKFEPILIQLQNPKTMANNDIWLKSLITKTPQEGRELAILMARKTIGAIQSDPQIKAEIREKYAKDAGQLIASAEVVALEFQTVAAANNYWK